MYKISYFLSKFEKLIKLKIAKLNTIIFNSYFTGDLSLNILYIEIHILLRLRKPSTLLDLPWKLQPMMP